MSVAQRELGNAADTTADLDEQPPVQSQAVPASESPSPAGDAVEAAAAAATSDQHDAAAVVRYPEAPSSGAPAADAQLLAAPDDGIAPRELQLHQPLPNGSAPDPASAAAKASDVAATQQQLPEGNAAAAMAAGTAQEGLEEATEPAAGHASAEQRSEQGSTRGMPTAGEAPDDDSTTARSRGGSSAASAAASPTAASASLATAGVEARFCSHPSLLMIDASTAQRGCCSASRSETTSAHQPMQLNLARPSLQRLRSRARWGRRGLRGAPRWRRWRRGNCSWSARAARWPMCRRCAGSCRQVRQRHCASRTPVLLPRNRVRCQHTRVVTGSHTACIGGDLL
jgi:hypothetical protein